MTAPGTKPKSELSTRPPIVVIVGHIDHGKTTLLDFIRKSRVAEREAGGITQGIGAYQTEHEGKKITFIDTPGHETFSAIRGRGARVADVAVLVIAGDEGVKPQTEEAIRIIKENELPFAVAINKMDRPNADPARVKNELAEKGVLVEGFGGTVPAIEISAKTGAGVGNLLETILLLAELEELTYDPASPGQGVVIESHLDPKRGPTATLLIQNGVVRQGEFLTVRDLVAPVRIFENYLGKPVSEASASEPIRIAGFPRVPELGEPFRMFPTRAEAEAARQDSKKTAEKEEAAPSKTVVNIILKADVLGSKEAVEETIKKISSPELSARILKSDVGDITESDVKLVASSKNAFIAGFKVKIPGSVKDLAERQGVTVVLSDIVYELLDAIKAAMIAIAPAEIRRVDLGKARLLAFFKEERGKQIVGGRVEQGKIQKGMRFDVVRNNVKVGAGKIADLQSQRKSAEEVSEGQEFGILADASITLAAQDVLEVYTEEKVAPRL